MLLLHFSVQAQQPTYNFHKLGLQQGLHDGTTRCIGQDKYGFIWIGSAGALNRFDGKNVAHFAYRPNDSSSPYSSQPMSIYSDPRGRLWIGYQTGLVRYDFGQAAFMRMPAMENIFIYKIFSTADTSLFLATRRGFTRLHPQSGEAFHYYLSEKSTHTALIGNPVFDIAFSNGKLFLATFKGLVIFDPATDVALLIPIPILEGRGIIAVAVDKQGNVWMGLHEALKLLKLKSDYKTVEVYDKYLSTDFYTQPLNVWDILVDAQNKVWVATSADGLLEYEESGNRFIIHLHNPQIPTSPAANNYRAIFQDDKGIIWLACDYDGVNFFTPDPNMFQTIFPFPDRLNERSRKIARAVTEDAIGNLWMGNHDGVSRYNPQSDQYTTWRNMEGEKHVIYNNMVRSILCDDDNNIWIGTSNGVNKYNNKTGQMEFVPPQNLPRRFYNSINKDRSGNIWFCTNDSNSLYWYNPKQDSFFSIRQHPYLNKYAGFTPTSYVLEDSKGRLWISFARKGVVMYDKSRNQLRHYMASIDSTNNIIGNQVIDIKEDKAGVIWISTFNGISGIDTKKDTIISFNSSNGFTGNMASPLVVDTLNQIWVGVHGGLIMLDAPRQKITRFTLDDGLPSLGFPEHAGIMTANKDIIFPSNNGFVRFNPANYQPESRDLRFYLAGYSIFDRPVKTPQNNEDSMVLHLKADENSFSFNLVALNYLNPSQTWYAYKLDGFDKEWKYTKEPRAIYTNIPGGSYNFLYKASIGNSQWERIQAKSLSIKVATTFYRTLWFWGLIILLAAGAIYALYHYRLQQQGQILSLETKAATLEKEKAMIQYESLKQHLNPHFLFNSLTSLRSLIKTDAVTAAWFLDGLSKVYRYVLRSADQELVSLSDELEYVENFTGLQKVRFGEGLQMTIDIDEPFKAMQIAPAVLQNLVENAIKHNTTSVNKPLRIVISTDGEYVSVRNNLQRYRVVETSNKSGLNSLKKLYRFYTEKEIKVSEDEHNFTVAIPLI